MDSEELVVNIEENLENLISEQSKEVLQSIRVLASNERSNPKVLKVIEKAIKEFQKVGDSKGLVNLYGLKILQLEHLKENIAIIIEILSKMKNLAEQLEYNEGLALSYCYAWYIEKIQGNKVESRREISKAIKIIDQLKHSDQYIYFFIKYSQAVEEWIKNHNISSADILEKCLVYFANNGFYRSMSQTLGILLIIYQRTQNKAKIIEIPKKLFSSNFTFNKYPKDLKAISYYFAGLGKLLNHNLQQAENLFEESDKIFCSSIKGSVYYTYHYCRLNSHIANVHALQGKIEKSFERIKKTEELFYDKYISKNLDEYSNKQVPHSLNLIKFYIYSRIFGFNHNVVQELIETIYLGIKDNYSDSIMLSEFLLNANLSYNKLNELKRIENASLQRVDNIMNYATEKARKRETKQEEQLEEYIRILTNKPKIKDLTFTEKAFTDLLVTQELYSHSRFVDIYQLLKKYENQINRIDVLEMRIFIEAFIQVGKFKNGDPLAPALHFMAIKRCKELKFGRLERILVEQQNTLYNLALKSINIEK